MSTHSEFLYRLQPLQPAMLTRNLTPEEEGVLAAHVDYLACLASQGVVIMAGRTLQNDETTFGIVVLRAPTEDAARAVMVGDPAVRHGLMSAELFAFRVAIRADGPR